MPDEASKDAKKIAVNDATIGAAIRQAARDAIERHRQAGLPVGLREERQDGPS